MECLTLNPKHSKPNTPIALKGVKVSSTTPTPLHDPMHKLREHYGGLSDSEETEILNNLAGFASILHGWQVAYEAELLTTPNKEAPDDEKSDP
jgi:hypothetical protein